MIKSKKYILIIFTIIIIIAIIIILIINNNNNGQESIDNIANKESNIKHDHDIINENMQVEYNNKNIEQLKQEYKIIGENKLYQVEKEFDGREVLNIKPSINYKVAFVGMIKQNLPNLQEIDSIFDKEYPKKNGIWINESSRDKVINFLNHNDKLNTRYNVDEEGYLQQKEASYYTELDNIIQRLIKCSKQYIIDVSSKCYMVDVVTGKVIEYKYNDLDSYQTYEYFEDNNRVILFISENIDKKLNEDEIFDSIIKLLDNN